MTSALKFEKRNVEDFWALNDVSFSVNPGESIGIIGRNGAGKSTLLKILSKITPPTSGSIVSRGRVASLLEVGTGFHPELTGRENIYFNGSLLGMKRFEIDSKFDEIVDFSGVEKFLDTPLKHFSSGMQLRLAFAVAAFLEPEILIIDEVLAVGDAEFQKKCLGKMEDVSKSGRTILFVSHHMVAVRKLCSTAVLLADGRIQSMGNVNTVTDAYLKKGLMSNNEISWHEKDFTAHKIQPLRACVYARNSTVHDPIKSSDDIILEIDFVNKIDSANVDVTFDIYDSTGVHLTHFGMICDESGRLKKGAFRTRGIIPGKILNTNTYTINVMFGLNQSEILYQESDILNFEVVDDIATRGKNFGKLPGIIHPVCVWKTLPLTSSYV
ncbi:MAG: ATP-binding cassette domain-containing protein [Cytophagia bacterium]|nr:ATP-binding cassette domain-containing protein [Cytophagia bacterium]